MGSAPEWMKSKIREEAARVGLDPEAAVNLVDVTGLEEIPSAVRAATLDHPEHVRDPAALRLSPAEAYGHFMRLVGQGRTAEAEKFQAREADAIAIGKSAARRETEAATEARAHREREARRLAEAIRLKEGEVASQERTLAFVEQFKEWPWNGMGTPLPPPRPDEVEAFRMKHARAFAELSDLRRERDALE